MGLYVCMSVTIGLNQICKVSYFTFTCINSQRCQHSKNSSIFFLDFLVEFLFKEFLLASVMPEGEKH